MEAAACGTPTVASDSPGLRDAVVNQKTGVLVPHGDIDSLAGALRKLLVDSRTREEMGTAARIHAESYSWENSAEKMEVYLEARVAGGHRRA
jgi:glycosyltransferase involved in cell wall biosynthesis